MGFHSGFMDMDQMCEDVQDNGTLASGSDNGEVDDASAGTAASSSTTALVAARVDAIEEQLRATCSRFDEFAKGAGQPGWRLHERLESHVDDRMKQLEKRLSDALDVRLELTAEHLHKSGEQVSQLLLCVQRMTGAPHDSHGVLPVPDSMSSSLVKRIEDMEGELARSAGRLNSCVAHLASLDALILGNSEGGCLLPRMNSQASRSEALLRPHLGPKLTHCAVEEAAGRTGLSDDASTKPPGALPCLARRVVELEFGLAQVRKRLDVPEENTDSSPPRRERVLGAVGLEVELGQVLGCPMDVASAHSSVVDDDMACGTEGCSSSRSCVLETGDPPAGRHATIADLNEAVAGMRFSWQSFTDGLKSDLAELRRSTLDEKSSLDIRRILALLQSRVAEVNTELRHVEQRCTARIDELASAHNESLQQQKELRTRLDNVNDRHHKELDLLAQAMKLSECAHLEQDAHRAGSESTDSRLTTPESVLSTLAMEAKVPVAEIATARIPDARYDGRSTRSLGNRPGSPVRTGSSTQQAPTAAASSGAPGIELSGAAPRVVGGQAATKTAQQRVASPSPLALLQPLSGACSGGLIAGHVSPAGPAVLGSKWMSPQPNFGGGQLLRQVSHAHGQQPSRSHRAGSPISAAPIPSNASHVTMAVGSNSAVVSCPPARVSTPPRPKSQPPIGRGQAATLLAASQPPTPTGTGTPDLDEVERSISELRSGVRGASSASHVASSSAAFGGTQLRAGSTAELPRSRSASMLLAAPRSNPPLVSGACAVTAQVPGHDRRHTAPMALFAATSGGCGGVQTATSVEGARLSASSPQVGRPESQDPLDIVHTQLEHNRERLRQASAGTSHLLKQLGTS